MKRLCHSPASDRQRVWRRYEATGVCAGRCAAGSCVCSLHGSRQRAAPLYAHACVLARWQGAQSFSGSPRKDSRGVFLRCACVGVWQDHWICASVCHSQHAGSTEAWLFYGDLCPLCKRTFPDQSGRSLSAGLDRMCCASACILFDAGLSPGCRGSGSCALAPVKQGRQLRSGAWSRQVRRIRKLTAFWRHAACSAFAGCSTAKRPAGSPARGRQRAFLRCGALCAFADCCFG